MGYGRSAHDQIADFIAEHPIFAKSTDEVGIAAIALDARDKDDFEQAFGALIRFGDYLTTQDSTKNKVMIRLHDF